MLKNWLMFLYIRDTSQSSYIGELVRDTSANLAIVMTLKKKMLFY